MDLAPRKRSLARTCISCWWGQSSHGAGRTARAARLLQPRLEAASALAERPRPRSGRRLDLQSRRALRRLRGSDQRRRRPARLLLASSITCRPTRSARTSTRTSIATPRAICSACRPGLDSLVVGEPQILGQIKEAYGVAAAAQTRRAAAQQAVSLGVRRRQARAIGNGARRRRGLGQLRGRQPREEDLRQSGGPPRARRRRRRDGQADGGAPQGAGRRRDRHHQPHAGARAGAGRRSRRRVAPWDALPQALARVRHRDHRHGLAAPDSVEGADRRRPCRPAARGRCFSSTSRCRATSIRAPRRSSRCSSTTSTTCRRSCARTSRSAAPRSVAPNRSSRKRCRSSRRWQRVARGGADHRGAAPAIRNDPPAGARTARAEAGAACRPRRARVSTRSRACIVEKLLLHPTEQLKNARRPNS